VELSLWDVAGVGTKALVYGATLCAAGGVFFECYGAPLISATQQGCIRRWVGLCVGVAVVASAARLAVIAGSMDDGWAGMFDGAMLGLVLQGGEARATGIRILGLALIGVGVWRALRPMTLVAAFAGAVVASTSFAWIGHAWAARNGGLSIALLGIHLAGVALWVGALMPLLVVGREGDLQRFAGIARRFGEVAVHGVLLLLLAGGLVLTTLLAHVTELWSTDYGRLMCVKLAGVASLLGAAAWNKLRLTPRLQNHDHRAFQSLVRSIKIEMVLAALILIVTATLTSLVGPATR
jgi:putative copper resistance protein D